MNKKMASSGYPLLATRFFAHKTSVSYFGQFVTRNLIPYRAIMSSNSLANRLRATCRRRLIVPIGESNSSLISAND